MYDNKRNVIRLIYSSIAAYQSCFSQCMVIHFYTGFACKMHLGTGLDQCLIPVHYALTFSQRNVLNDIIFAFIYTAIHKNKNTRRETTLRIPEAEVRVTRRESDIGIFVLVTFDHPHSCRQYPLWLRTSVLRNLSCRQHNGDRSAEEGSRGTIVSGFDIAAHMGQPTMILAPLGSFPAVLMRSFLPRSDLSNTSPQRALLIDCGQHQLMEVRNNLLMCAYSQHCKSKTMD